MKLKYVIILSLVLMCSLNVISAYNEDCLVWGQKYDYMGDNDYPVSLIVSDNNSYILAHNSYTTLNTLLVKYDKDGNLLWNTTYMSNPSHDIPRGMLKYGDYIYVSGDTYNSVNNSKGIMLLKYDLDGNLVWNRSYNKFEKNQGFSGFSTYGDYIYVIGQNDNARADGLLFLKYDLDGNLVFNKTYDNESKSEGLVSCGEYNNAFYIVYNEQGDSSSNFGLVKYDLDGNLLWNRTYNYSKYDCAKCLKFYDNGIYLIGEGYATNYDTVILRYDIDGNLLWNKTYDYKSIDNEPLHTVMSNGKLYILGYEDITSQNILISTFDSDGNLLWNTTYDYSGRYDAITSVSAYNDTLYVLGIGINESQDIILLKYDSNGNLLWDRAYDYHGEYDRAVSMGVYNNNINIIGYGYNSSQNTILLKYDADGNLLSHNSYMVDSLDNEPKRMVIQNNNIYVLGHIWNNDNYDLYLLNYIKDEIAPNITINTPNGTLKTNNIVINVSTDDGLVTSGIKEVIANVNNENITLNKTGNYYTASKTLNDGNYLLNITAIDNANNSNSTSTTFTIDTYVPSSNSHHKTLDASDSIESSNMKRTVSESTVVYGSNFDKQLAEGLKENIYPDDYEITGDTIIVGGPVSNKIAEQYNDRFVKPVSNNYPGENRGIIQILKIQDNSASVVQSYNVVYIAGSDRLGTEAALKYFETLKELPTEPIIVEWTSEGPVLV
ncbi:hypothetical protein [Methanococcus voltae]|uniref:S-layer protein outer domain-containing protein n=1 Tax=Methanococcus voltae (strain ATCC BAA-1334 / A3) TaxID=456320 RepID=D7DT46_METV3|nr:hypothetical protein [Methanococcus voltae]MCS3901838.1 hypothetical protein [Methanococcus voltae]